MILVRIEKVKGLCQIRGFEDFFHVNSLDLGAESSLKESGGDGFKKNFTVKKDREPEEVSLDRTADFLTPTLMALTIKGRTQSEQMFSTIDVCFVQLRADAGSSADMKAYLLLRFGGARFVSWKLSGSESGEPTESLEFKYKQVAIQYRSTEEGKVYTKSTVQTWDFELNKEWTAPPEWSK